MNLSGTVEIQKPKKRSKREPQTMSLQSLIAKQNSIKHQNQEYVNFIKEIEEMSPEEETFDSKVQVKKSKAKIKKKTLNNRSFQMRQRNQKPKSKEDLKSKNDYETRKNTISVSGKGPRDWTEEELVNFDTEKLMGSESNISFEYNSKMTTDWNKDVGFLIQSKMKLVMSLRITLGKFGSEKQGQKSLIGFWRFMLRVSIRNLI